MRKVIIGSIMAATTLIATGEEGLKNLRGVDQELDGIFLREIKYDDWTYIGAEEGVITKVVNDILKENKGKDGFLDTATREYGDGNWQYEWDQIAAEAERSGDYEKAAAYYTVSAYPYFKDSRENYNSYVVNAMENYQKVVEEDGFYYEKIEVDTPQGKAYANLHLPEKNGKDYPVVIFTGGSDVFAIEYYRLFKEYLAEQGIAYISFELPGMGINSHLTYTPDTNIVHRGVIEKIKKDPRFNGKIVVGASSLGGQPAVRTAFTNEEDVTAVVNFCGALSDVWKGINPETVSYLPMLNQVVLADRLDTSIKGFAEAAPEYSLENQGYLGKMKTSVDIMSIGTSTDPVAPVSDAELVTDASDNGVNVIVASEVGHGMPRSVVLPLISGYIVDKLK
ncbi:UPF0255 protein [Propionigenium maris DSM 9537]|uniref:UPF0255 protein n=1 Tax=Propionigenium maris DSM 9537 TaxID=1123000 RepID=A0A9W6GJC0_9FUSO|nr:alpha/beta fold hydrolase [Propionigenium maris]GLI55177.1 UPF0255 protein [Propionigenium maris DSM 9537]